MCLLFRCNESNNQIEKERQRDWEREIILYIHIINKKKNTLLNNETISHAPENTVKMLYCMCCWNGVVIGFGQVFVLLTVINFLLSLSPFFGVLDSQLEASYTTHLQWLQNMSGFLSIRCIPKICHIIQGLVVCWREGLIFHIPHLHK